MEKRFSKIMELVEYMVSLQSGEPYESFRQSVIADFIDNGYSEERANQVIDEMEEKVKQTKNRN